MKTIKLTINGMTTEHDVPEDGKIEIQVDEVKKEEQEEGVLFYPKKDDYYYAVSQESHGFTGFNSFALGRDASQALFKKESDAQDFAEALNVYMKLRMCEGAQRYGLYISLDECNCIHIEREDSLTGSFLPCFKMMFDAKNAIKKVGEDRIIKAIKTWSKI